MLDKYPIVVKFWVRNLSQQLELGNKVLSFGYDAGKPVENYLAQIAMAFGEEIGAVIDHKVLFDAREGSLNNRLVVFFEYEEFKLAESTEPQEEVEVYAHNGCYYYLIPVG